MSASDELKIDDDISRMSDDELINAGRQQIAMMKHLMETGELLYD